MLRQPRIEYEHAFYHVMNRGGNYIATHDNAKAVS
jgi:hypothetical protein